MVGLVEEESGTPLLPRELIISCNDAKITTAAELERALSVRSRGAKVTLEVARPDGERRIVTLDTM